MVPYTFTIILSNVEVGLYYINLYHYLTYPKLRYTPNGNYHSRGTVISGVKSFLHKVKVTLYYLAMAQKWATHGPYNKNPEFFSVMDWGHNLIQPGETVPKVSQ